MPSGPGKQSAVNWNTTLSMRDSPMKTTTNWVRVDLRLRRPISSLLQCKNSSYLTKKVTVIVFQGRWIPIKQKFKKLLNSSKLTRARSSKILHRVKMTRMRSTMRRTKGTRRIPMSAVTKRINKRNCLVVRPRNSS